MARFLIAMGPLGVRCPGGKPTRPIADFMGESAAALVEKGQEVLLLFSKRPPNEYERRWLAERGIRWEFWGQGRPTTCQHGLTLYRVLHSWKPAVAIFQFGAVNLGLLMSYLVGVPIRIAWYRTGLVQFDRGLIERLIEDLKRLRKTGIYRLATHIMANSPQMVDEVTLYFKVRSNKVSFQYSGVRLPETNLDVMSKSRRRNIACVGGLMRRKGQRALIQALGILRSRGVKINARFVGPGDPSELRTLAAQLGVLDQCQFLGLVSRQEVYKILQRVELAIQPSLSEAQGVAAMEAMACGAILIASRVGGLQSLLEDEISGLLVEPGDANELAEAIERVLKDPVLADRLREGGRKRADFFEMSKRANSHAELLLRLASGIEHG